MDDNKQPDKNIIEALSESNEILQGMQDAGLAKGRYAKEIPSVITNSSHHRAIDGDKMVEVREAMGMSQTEFAKAVGHSQQFQSRIERPGLHEVTTNVAKPIQKLITNHFTTD